MTMDSLILLLLGALALSAGVIRFAYLRALRCSRRLWREHGIAEPRTRVGGCVRRMIGEYYR